MTEINTKIAQMLDINIKQKNHYEFDFNHNFKHNGNFISKIWDKFRTFLYKMIDDFAINQKLLEYHKHWLGDLKTKKVLDLGCHHGNALSEYLAKNSRQYFAVDLSESALNVLKNKLLHIEQSKLQFISTDILSDEFTERNFDVVYAIDVFHHFKYFDELIHRIKSVTKEDSIIITSDPMNTYIPMKIIRAVYRNFQTDKAWEHPFSKKTIASIQDNFEIIDYAGMMGKMKYAFLIYLFSSKLAKHFCSKLMDEDFSHTPAGTPRFWKLLRISYHLKPKSISND